MLVLEMPLPQLPILLLEEVVVRDVLDGLEVEETNSEELP
jgi:hypothetical protein